MSDIKESIEEVIDKAERPSDRLNSTVAALVAVLATVMALFNVKDGNVVQAMAQAQARSIDTWSYFQAKSTKQALAENMVDQFTLERARGAAVTPEAGAALDQKIAFYRDKATRYEHDKDEIKKQAEAYEAEYDRLNIHDDQFDIADAGISVALAVLGIAALTRRSWLVWFALLFAGVGLASGISGFVGGDFHLDFLASLLS